MAYGSGAWQNDPRVANKENEDKNGFDRMLQLAALASMMDGRTAAGFGIGSLLANYFARQRQAQVDKKANGVKSSTDNPEANTNIMGALGYGSTMGTPITLGAMPQKQETLGSLGMKPGNTISGGVPMDVGTAWQDTPTSAEVQQAAASVFGQTPQGTAGATVSAPTTLTLVNPAGAQQFQWPTVNTDWLHRNS